MFLTIGPALGGRQRSGKHVGDTGTWRIVERGIGFEAVAPIARWRLSDPSPDSLLYASCAISMVDLDSLRGRQTDRRTDRAARGNSAPRPYRIFVYN